MSKNKFIRLRVKNHIVVHGYNDKNEEITEEVLVDAYSDKVIAVDRIKSVSEKYILIDYIGGRWIYWEYEEDFNEVAQKLAQL